MSDEQKKDDAQAPAEEKQEEKTEEKEEVQQATADASAGDTDSADEEVEVPEKFKALIEQIEQMSVLDLSELVKVLEKKFGVSAAAPVAVAAAAGGGAGDGGAAEEKSEFTVELAGVGDNKIGVIKAVREITQKGLKEAKDLVDNAPSVIAEGVKKEEAEEMKKKLEEAGGQVNLK